MSKIGKWPQCNKFNKDPLEWADCIIRESVERGLFAHHQLKQVDQLTSMLRDNNHDLPISVLSVEQATDFMIELGVHDKDDTHVVRHRNSQTYIGSGGKMSLASQGTLPPDEEMPDIRQKAAAFCALKATDLKPNHLKRLCKAYEADVELLRSAKLEVPLCDDDDDESGNSVVA